MMERQSSDSTATIDFAGAVPATVAPAGTVSKASVWTSAICILGLSAMSAGNSMRPGRTTIRRTVGRPTTAQVSTFTGGGDEYPPCQH